MQEALNRLPAKSSAGRVDTATIMHAMIAAVARFSSSHHDGPFLNISRFLDTPASRGMARQAGTTKSISKHIR
jgi:hypothetical protein